MFSPILVIKHFGRDETGTVMAETLIVLPMLLWAYLALFVYWDSFRSMNKVQKATYTISDTISREMATVPSTYFDGLQSVMGLLIDGDQTVKLRVTSITFDQDEDKYKVLWSYSPNGGFAEYTDATLASVRGKIPNMSDADFATIVETEVPFTPVFNVGLTLTTFKQFIVTRPRFVAPTCMTGRTCTPA
jgi:Flp pilus assembly protein TadG